MERNFTEQELVRRNKLENLVNLGIDPFGHRFERTGYALDIKEKYQDISHDEFENRNDIEVVKHHFSQLKIELVIFKYIFQLMM